MNSDSILLKATGIKKSFGRLKVLKGVDLEVCSGELLSIMGASGAGKSTLLHILGTLDQPDEGDVIYSGKSLFERDERECALYRNREIGFVFQFHHLLTEFTVLENVMMPCLIGGIKRKDAVERAERVLARVGLSERLTHLPGELSGGEQQRVAVARALVMSPKLLLADEPTGNLDTETGEEVFNLLKDLNSEGLTIVLVTHNMELSKRAHRIVKIKDGIIC